MESVNNTGKQKNRIKTLVVVLVMICLVQGGIIYYLVHPGRKITDSIDDFSNRLHKKFGRNQKSQWDSFDRFFDDDFFKREQNPFNELEKFHKRMEKMMGKSLNDSFNQSWDSWLQDRFSTGSDQMDMKTEERKNEYIITINVRNLKDNKLIIDIDENGIEVKGDFTQALEKKDSSGRIISKQEKRQSITRKFPIPGDADYKKADIKHQDDEIIIKLPKKVG